MQSFKVITTSNGKMVLFLLAIIVGTIFLIIATSFHFPNSELILAFLALGFGSAWLLVRKYKGKTIQVNLDENGIQRNNEELIFWDTIATYNVDQSSAYFDFFKIKLKNGKTLRISHRKRDARSDGFSAFLIAFRQYRTQYNASLPNPALGIHKGPTFYDSKWAKPYAFLMIAGVGALVVMFWQKKDATAADMGRIVMVCGTAIPFISRIFTTKRKKNFS